MIVPTSLATLTVREERFAREYCLDGNGTEAAIRAGYAPGSAAQKASALLRKPEVRAVVSRVKRASFDKIEVSAHEVLRELGAVAFGNMQDFVKVGEDGLPELDLSRLERADWACLAEFSEDATGGTGDGERRQVLRRRVKFHSKTHALEMLARHFRMLTDRVEHDLSDRLVERLQAGRARAARVIDVESAPDTGPADERPWGR